MPLPHAASLTTLSPKAFFWQAFDPASKSELFSTAIATDQSQLILVDPIPLSQVARHSLLKKGQPAAIFVTNSNHWRSAADTSQGFGIPIWAHQSIAQDGPPETQAIDPENPPFFGLKILPIVGAAKGEIALHFEDDAGILVVGDSLIHFHPYGLAFLPKKYCLDARQMRHSLRQLLDQPSGRMLFAHGLPIVSRTMDRLKALLES